MGTKIDCGCGRVTCVQSAGPSRKRAFPNGELHTRGCDCQRCQLAEDKTKAMRRETAVAKMAGGRRNPLSGARGGADGIEGFFDFEETSEFAVIRGFRRWVESGTFNRKFNRVLSNHRKPSVLALSWDTNHRGARIPGIKVTVQWVVMPVNDFRQMLNSLRAHYGIPEVPDDE